MGTNISRRSNADVQHVLDGVRRIVQGLRESSRDVQRRTGLTGAQLFVLRRLDENEGSSINDLAERTFTHQSSVSAVSSRLVSAGLVERRMDSRDRRKRVLRITPRGQKALAAAPMAAQERLVSAVLSLPRSERRAIADALAHMADAMVVRRRPVMFFEDRARA
jgi:DNA-binding MarR family transcriptional regulator